MLKVRSWERWQGDALYDRLRKRTKSGRTKPISLVFIAIATDLDDPSGNFKRFADAVGGGVMARGYLLAVLGHAGRHAATTGVVRCAREQLGPVVLTDRLDTVSSARGVKVYDALVASGIAEEIREEDVGEIVPPPSGEGSPPSSPRSAGAEERRGEERTKSHPDLPVPGRDGSASPLTADGEELRVLAGVVSRRGGCSTAEELHDAIEADLRAIGWTVVREWEVPDRGDGKPGRIDLVATAPARIAMELDNKSPRVKSLFKLRQFDGARVVVLRDDPGRNVVAPGVIVLVAGRPQRAGKPLPSGVVTAGTYKPGDAARALAGI